VGGGDIVVVILTPRPRDLGQSLGEWCGPLPLVQGFAARRNPELHSMAFLVLLVWDRWGLRFRKSCASPGDPARASQGGVCMQSFSRRSGPCDLTQRSLARHGSISPLPSQPAVNGSRTF